MPSEKLLIEEEEWRDIPGWEGIYQVSSHGRVKRLCGLSIDGKRRIREKILKSYFFTKKYKSAYVNLGNSKKHFVSPIARLMLMAFVRMPKSDEECCHRDDNPENNTFQNLYWGTNIENRKDFVRNGKSPKGSRNARAKLTESQVKYIKTCKDPNIKFLSQQFGVTNWTIRTIIKGKLWSHV